MTGSAAVGASTKENPRRKYATGPAGLARLVRGSSRRIMIMRFRPANISLINRRHYLPRLLLTLSLKMQKQKPPQRVEDVDRVTPYQFPGGPAGDLTFTRAAGNAPFEGGNGKRGPLMANGGVRCDDCESEKMCERRGRKPCFVFL